MARQIYRQAAIDRLASPEQLDRPYKLVSGLGWLTLAALLAIIVSGAVWALISEAPVKVRAQGIVLQRGGLREIVADTPGRIETLELAAGQIIALGAPVAGFQRSERLRDVQQAEAELVDAKARLAALEGFYQNQNVFPVSIRETVCSDSGLEDFEIIVAVKERR